ncbi:hypothetical protein [Shewanella sp. YIC-542]|uniref:hypothetical protein n=1 Tax=Shewanella mytili TaxID=3377111 RepID=UPI00398EC623
MKCHQLAAVLMGTLCLSVAQASEEKLPYCSQEHCEKILHNKLLNQANMVVWKGDSEIIKTFTFDLDKDAKLSSVTQGVKQITNLSDNAITYVPAESCKSGSCSTSISYSYETDAELIGIVAVFIYYDGQLLDVDINEHRLPKSQLTSRK